MPGDAARLAANGHVATTAFSPGSKERSRWSSPRAEFARGARILVL